MMKHIQYLLLFISVFLREKCFSQSIPDEYYSRIRTADSLYRLTKYKKAAFAYSSAFKVLGWRGLPKDRYNAACCWARAGYPDSAVFNLNRIITKRMFTDFDKLYSERSFARLRNKKVWKEVEKNVKKVKDSVALVESRLDKSLIKRLDSLRREDQKWRNLSRRIENGETPKDSIDMVELMRNWKRSDSLNIIMARNIFYRYGFPNYDLAGNEGSNNFWLLIQHADKHPVFQDSVLSAMKTECEKGKASWINYAYLLDRVRVNTGRLQVYGSQMQINSGGTSYEPKPVEDPEKLNSRRKALGMGTIEEYIEVMNTRYKGSLNKK